MKIPSILIALATTLMAQEPAASIDQVSPGAEFQYGHHKLKWTADANSNQRMDQGEVHAERNGEWTELNEKEFKQTVTRRRNGLYIPNAFTYKKTPTRDLNLYATFPADWNANDKRPAMLWFFGGAWTTGTPFAFKAQADYFSKRGVVSICADYRILTVDGINNDGFLSAHDAKTALRWIRKNAASLGIDPDHIMVGGDSAGGHLAFATQLPDLNDPSDDLTIPTNVSAIIAHNPYVVHINPESWLFQMDFKKLPPVWIAYGLKDTAAYNDDPASKRTERNGESFIKDLGNAGVTLKTFIREDGGHGFCSSPKFLEEAILDKNDFLIEHKLLPAGKVENYKPKHTGAWIAEHTKNIISGKAPLVQPKVLKFPTRE